MKRYVKPELYYENFELSQHIAKCEWDFQNNVSAESCYAKNEFEDFAGIALFMIGVTNGCTNEEEMCYSLAEQTENSIVNNS